MKHETYTVTIEVSKPGAEVFNHLLHDVSKFWPEEMEGECAKLNDEFIFRTGDAHYSKNKVIECVPGKKVVWLVTGSIRKPDNFDWTGTKMIFELTAKNNRTQLEFIYDGPVPENESERLKQVCDFVIKESLYNFLESFTATIEVAKSPEDVFHCIREVSKWWSKDFTGNSSKLNDEFIIHHPGAHFSKQKLVEVIPGKKIVWLVTESKLDWLKNDTHEWTNTKMIFEISVNGTTTILHFTHSGLVPEKECYARCGQGWNMVIKDWLFNLITKGQTI